MDSLSKEFGQFCVKNGFKVVTAESCTAGLIAATIAMTSGASEWLDSGFIVYTPESKNKHLKVGFNTISKFDITSVEVAEEMAIGALGNSNANLSLAVTGLAGSSGGTKEIPAGTICMAWGIQDDLYIRVVTEKKHFKGERNEIREAVVEYMLQKSMTLLDK
jgi:nicotinamide-nucleotide amidase